MMSEKISMKLKREKKERLALMRLYDKGHDCMEVIAIRLGVSRQAVSQRIQRARKDKKGDDA